MIRGFRIDLDSDEYEETYKIGLAGNEGSYGHSIMMFVKREICSYDEEYEEECEEYYEEE